MTVNGTAFPLTAVDGYLTIDSESMEVYKDTESGNSKFGGADFPKLETGENAVGWTGNVEKIVIEPGWRWL